MRPDFRNDFAEFIIEKAREFDHQEAIRQVERIRDFLGGNPYRMRELAAEWNKIDVIEGHVARLQGNNAELAGSWEGAAYESFNTHLGAVVSAMGTTSAAMGEMSMLMGKMLVKINEVFRTLLNLMADCHNALVEQVTGVGDILLAGATAGLSLTLTAIRVLSAFANNVIHAVTDAMVFVAEFEAAAIEIKVRIDSAQIPQPLPVNAGPAGRWEAMS